MKRLLYLETQPFFRAKEMVDQPQLNIFTPTRSAARALGRSQKRSLQDVAIQHLRTQGLLVAPPLEAQRSLREALHQTVSVPDIEGTARAWMPTVQALLRSSPLLTIVTEKVVTENGSARANQLIQVTQRYQALLRQDSFVDGAEVLWRALEQPPERVLSLIYGYFQPCLDELAFMDAIAGEGSVFCLPIVDQALFTHQKTVVAQLQQWDWQVEPTLSSPPETPGAWLAQQFLSQAPIAPPAALAIAAHAYPNQDAEARSVLAQVKQLLHKGVPAREIVVIARDEVAVGPLLLDIAWEYGVSLRALYSIPLSATRVGAWLTLLLTAIEQQFPFELTARLLSHPLSLTAGAEFWATVRQQRPNGLGAWQTTVQQLVGLDLSPLKVPTRARRDTWVAKLRDIFRTVDLRRRAARWARETVAYNALETGLVALSRPESEILTWQAFAAELLASLAVLTTPAQPGRGGVELHSPLSVMGARYRYMFVIGGVEGTLPAPVQNDPVLDFYERQQLQAQGIHLEGAAETARREALEFYALLHTATEQFTLSYAALEGEASAYFQRLGLSLSPAPVVAIASPEVLRQVFLRQDLRQGEALEDAVLERAIAAFHIEQHRESAAPPNEYDGVVGLPFDYSQHWFSASQLTQLGQCPFKWFAAKVLKLSAIEETDEDLNPGLRGVLYHKVLELALTAAQTEPGLDFTDATRLHAWFVEAEAIVKLPSLPVWENRRLEHIKRLRRAMQQPDFLTAGAEVLGLEQAFSGEWHGLKVRGYVDRIDRTDQGLVLVDYKTSSQAPAGVKDGNGKGTIDLQLPLYQAVAAPALYPHEPVHRTSYYSLTVGKDISPKTKPTDADLEAVADRLKHHLTTGNYPVAPDQKRETCTYCAYDSVCRKGDRLNRKGASA